MTADELARGLYFVALLCCLTPFYILGYAIGMIVRMALTGWRFARAAFAEGYAKGRGE